MGTSMNKVSGEMVSYEIKNDHEIEVRAMAWPS